MMLVMLMLVHEKLSPGFHESLESSATNCDGRPHRGLAALVVVFSLVVRRCRSDLVKFGGVKAGRYRQQLVKWHCRSFEALPRSLSAPRRRCLCRGAACVGVLLVPGCCLRRGAEVIGAAISHQCDVDDVDDVDDDDVDVDDVDVDDDDGDVDDVDDVDDDGDGDVFTG
ncbi:hypothetical protein FHG87_024435 [Trinorchestia longiramus]|nr:hypothetical protein FHG87_024435 [Trinorchestia longiramus]